MEYQPVFQAENQPKLFLLNCVPVPLWAPTCRWAWGRSLRRGPWCPRRSWGGWRSAWPAGAGSGPPRTWRMWKIPLELSQQSFVRKKVLETLQTALCCVVSRCVLWLLSFNIWKWYYFGVFPLIPRVIPRNFLSKDSTLCFPRFSSWIVLTNHLIKS